MPGRGASRVLAYPADMDDGVPDGALASLLDDELCFDATTADRLSSHLPMALVALHRLGADDVRLAEFADRYRHRLAPIRDETPVTSFDGWLAARGQPDAYAAVRPYLAARVRDEGVDQALRRHLPHLVDGVAGAAFHGVIRLAYALESASADRVAAGLAYLTSVHQPLGARGAQDPRTDDPVVALTGLREDRELCAAAPAARTIGARMRAVAAHRGFDGVVDRLAVGPDTPARLTAAALALYARTDDFTALHGVTGSHAISLVAPFIEDRSALSSWWFQALAAAYLTIGAPALDDPAAPVARWLEHPADWATVTSAATRSDDEHVVKLVYSARELTALAPPPLLAAVAARQAGVAPGARGGDPTADGDEGAP